MQEIRTEESQTLCLVGCSPTDSLPLTVMGFTLWFIWRHQEELLYLSHDFSTFGMRKCKPQKIIFDTTDFFQMLNGYRTRFDRCLIKMTLTNFNQYAAFRLGNQMLRYRLLKSYFLSIIWVQLHFEMLVPESRNLSALVMELPHSCTNPSLYV